MTEVLTYEAMKADRDVLAERVERLSGMLTESRHATKAAVERADALAMENAELKASRETLAKNALEACNDVFSAGFRNASLQLGLMESTGNRDLYPNPIKALVDEAIRELTTPATDSALAAIEARGADKFAAHLWKRGNELVAKGGKKNEVIRVRVAAKMAEMFADELREAK